eukprot:3084876-Alexandrium_andersonii.AAC.1
MAEPRRKAATPPQRHFASLSGLPPHSRRTMGEAAPTVQLGPLLHAPSRCVKASSSIVRRPSEGSPESAPKRL